MADPHPGYFLRSASPPQPQRRDNGASAETMAHPPNPPSLPPNPSPRRHGTCANSVLAPATRQASPILPRLLKPATARTCGPRAVFLHHPTSPLHNACGHRQARPVPVFSSSRTRSHRAAVASAVVDRDGRNYDPLPATRGELQPRGPKTSSVIVWASAGGGGDDDKEEARATPSTGAPPSHPTPIKKGPEDQDRMFTESNGTSLSVDWANAKGCAVETVPWRLAADPSTTSPEERRRPRRIEMDDRGRTVELIRVPAQGGFRTATTARTALGVPGRRRGSDLQVPTVPRVQSRLSPRILWRARIRKERSVDDRDKGSDPEMPTAADLRAPVRLRFLLNAMGH
ncbi:hypothetical protein S7711_11388 [Stachybotrys chartarum IBT 7711]|uniref:Uncharacterized protein n=1 Tax=Stachybotrys chartarum (strain CBS 109288 / IBT 7711) TaxID=1280523 RepID=A0A084BCF8_STACB|nr:hypothetical protein S7711_11388 [Stachybotrys chartarum IBT 7711]